jgi:hypothetical protein
MISNKCKGGLWWPAKNSLYKHDVAACGRYNRCCDLWWWGQNLPYHNAMVDGNLTTLSNITWTSKVFITTVHMHQKHDFKFSPCKLWILDHQTGHLFLHLKHVESKKNLVCVSISWGQIFMTMIF